jgi:hypothetical protein
MEFPRPKTDLLRGPDGLSGVFPLHALPDAEAHHEVRKTAAYLMRRGLCPCADAGMPDFFVSMM